MGSGRTKSLIAIFLLLCCLWVAQLVLLPAPLRLHSQSYWQNLTPEQLHEDISGGIVDVANLDVVGTGPLHWASAWAGDDRIIDILIEAGADISQRDSGSGRAALHLAALNPNPAIARALVRAGAELDAADSQQLRPLHLAAASNPNPMVLRELVKLGADLSATDAFGNTATHKAATTAMNTITMETLLDLGADLQARNTYGYRPLEMAVMENGSLEIIELLFERTANNIDGVNDGLGRNLLHLAAGSNSQASVVEFLLLADIDVNALDHHGLNAAHHAAGSNSESAVLQLLIKSGAETNQANSVDSYTPLHYAAAFNRDVATVQMLIEHGADASARTGKLQQTALHLCLIGNNIDDVCAYLAGLRGQLQLSDAHGHTAMHHALLNNYGIDLLRQFIELGAQLSAVTVNGVSVVDLIERKRLAGQLGLL